MYESQHVTRGWRGALRTIPLFLLAVACGTPESAPYDVLLRTNVRPGNPAVTPNGRLLFSQHPIDAPDYKVVELTRDGRVIPFPSGAWSKNRLGAVIGIEACPSGNVWMLDMGGEGFTPKLVAWDSENESLAHQIQIPASVRRDDSFLQDLAVMEDLGVVVIADMTFPEPFMTPAPALVVIDIEMGTARRVLEGHPSFMPDVSVINIEGSRLERLTEGGELQALKLALNPISADPTETWVYYGAVSGSQIWRIPAKSLADPSIGDKELAQLIEPYATKAPSDGFRVDGAGRVFVTDLQASGIGVATPSGYRVAFSDARRMPWPDGLAFGPDGSLIVTVNQLHLHPNHNGGLDESRAPYSVIRLNGLMPNP